MRGKMLMERVKRRPGHKGVDPRGKKKKKLTTVPDKCVASNRRNVVDLSEYILVNNIPFFRD